MRWIKYFLVLSLFLVGSLYYLTVSDVSLKGLLRYSQRHFAKDILVDWDAIDFKVESNGLLGRRVLLKSDKGCVSGTHFKVCYELLDFDFVVNLMSPSNIQFKKVRANITNGFFKSAPSEGSSDPVDIGDSLKSLYAQIENFKNYEPDTLDLEVADFRIIENERENIVELKINKQRIDLSYSGADLLLLIDLKKEEGNFKGVIDFTQRDLKIKTSMSFNFKDGLHLLAENKVFTKQLSEPIRHNMDLVFTKEVLKLELQSLKVSYKFDTSITADSCSLMVNYRESEELDISCPDVGVNINDKVKLRALLKSSINNTINLRDSEKLLSFNVDIKNIDRKDFNFRLVAQAKIFAEKGDIRFKVDDFKWRALTDRFERIVRKLKGTSFAIPAPINTMKGEVVLGSQKKAEMLSESLTIPMNAEIKLGDMKKNQISLNFSGEFIYASGQKPQLNGKSIIEKIYLNIPPIDPLKKIPSLTPSTRINSEIVVKKEKNPEPSLLYDVSIRTRDNQSIRLYYQYLEPALKMGLIAEMKNNYLSYKVTTDSTVTAKYLKREVKLIRMKVDANHGEEPTIDAELNYDTSGYKIILSIIGTTSAPKLILSSRPSVSREDIISLLIYNRKVSQVSSSQKQSIGGTEAAIEDKALSLFSIWAFASTPIDYVRYDQSSKTYSASVSLPGDTSLEIGTDWEKVNNLSLRKQLSDTWSIETSYNPNEDAGKQSMMLQKEISF